MKVNINRICRVVLTEVGAAELRQTSKGIISKEAAAGDVWQAGFREILRRLGHIKDAFENEVEFEPFEEAWQETPNSSNVAAFRYDTESNLFVKFKGGGIYRYSGVPKSEYIGLTLAESPGGFVNSHLKNKYPCERVEE